MQMRRGLVHVQVCREHPQRGIPFLEAAHVLVQDLRRLLAVRRGGSAIPSRIWRCSQACASPLPPGCPHCVIRSRGLWLARLKCLWHFKFRAKPETADGRFCESSAAPSEYHYPHHASWRAGPAAGLPDASVDRSTPFSRSSRRDAFARGGAPRFMESSRAGRAATDFASGKVTSRWERRLETI